MSIVPNIVDCVRRVLMPECSGETVKTYCDIVTKAGTLLQLAALRRIYQMVPRCSELVWGKV